jgi:hypothetical protein
MAGFKSKKPKTGFNRPQATAGQAVSREWKDVPANSLEPGDIIAGLGIVTEVASIIRPFVHVTAGHPEKKTHKLQNTSLVKAFVRKGD